MCGLVLSGFGSGFAWLVGDGDVAHVFAHALHAHEPCLLTVRVPSAQHSPVAQLTYELRVAHAHHPGSFRQRDRYLMLGVRQDAGEGLHGPDQITQTDTDHIIREIPMHGIGDTAVHARHHTPVLRGWFGRGFGVDVWPRDLLSTTDNK